MNDKARILFVDDEQRVLNSMRGLFRREYELFLTTIGADAVRIASENDIDVVVADQRMPGMTGIEVLGKIKENTPRTVRILLTGYADPSAVEGSINIGEVFRFLSKPCPPGLLRETLALAVNAARTRPVTQSTNPGVATAPRPAPVVIEPGAAPAPTVATRPAPSPASPPAPAPAHPAADIPVRRPASIAELFEPPPENARGDDDDTEPALPVLDIEAARAAEAAKEAKEATGSHWQSVTNVVMSVDNVEETQQDEGLSTSITRGMKDISVVVFTVDSEFAEMAIRALSPDRNTILATSLVKVAQAVESQGAGVLVTDFTANSAVLKKMIGALKQYLPELVTIVVSDGRDTTDMINLINYGQVFRYVLKPLKPSHLRSDVNAAAIRCLYLLNNPESIKRHQVIETPLLPDSTSTLNKFLGRIRKIQSARSDSSDLITK